MPAREARTGAAGAAAAPDDSKERDVKIPVEAVDDTEQAEGAGVEATHDDTPEQAQAEQAMSEEEMIEAAIRAGEEAAENDFKLKYEQAQAELADVRRELAEAKEQLDDAFAQFVDGVDAVRTKMLDVFAHEGVEAIDPKGEPFNPLEHQAVGRVEDPSQYDETVNDVYQKGYRMADRVLRSAMVTVTYGGEKRPAPEAEAADEPAPAAEPESGAPEADAESASE